MSLIAAPFAILAILYAGGFLAQLLGNYATWKQGQIARPGPVTERNAIRILEICGYPQEVVQEAYSAVGQTSQL